MKKERESATARSTSEKTSEDLEASPAGRKSPIVIEF